MGSNLVLNLDDDDGYDDDNDEDNDKIYYYVNSAVTRLHGLIEKELNIILKMALIMLLWLLPLMKITSIKVIKKER